MGTKNNNLMKPMQDSVSRSITFQRFVIEAIEKKAKERNIKVSPLINELVKRTITTDTSFFHEMAKFHIAEFHKFQYMIKELEAKKEI